MKPGVHYGLDINFYHADEGISNSGLSLIARSPLHYYARYLDPRRPAEKDRKGDQLTGELLHCALLEPGAFDNRYAFTPPDAPARPTDAMRNAKNPSESSVERVRWWDAFNFKNDGKTIITSEQTAEAYAQAASIRALPEIGKALANGHSEVSAYWVDEATGELCRCRPDFVSEVDDESVILIDAKTYSDASPNEFRRQIARMGYHVQAAWYSDGYEKASNKAVLGFIFAAVETEFPYAACPIMIDDEAMRQGRQDYRRLLDLYAQCRFTEAWPGYANTIEVVSLPNWALNKEY
jgi:exodeoxyribonuclease VIII